MFINTEFGYWWYARVPLCIGYLFITRAPSGYRARTKWDSLKMKASRLCTEILGGGWEDVRERVLTYFITHKYVGGVSGWYNYGLSMRIIAATSHWLGSVSTAFWHRQLRGRACHIRWASHIRTSENRTSQIMTVSWMERQFSVPVASALAGTVPSQSD